MKAYQLQARNLDGLKLIELPEPSVGTNDVLVRIRANSMNYRELLIVRGGYVRNKKIPVIPADDGVGEVVSVGNTVTAFQHNAIALLGHSFEIGSLERQPKSK